eukprot:TRINITY_DN38327_c0_g1_i1.p1 TRINITY_DN38327_c0_g1~~TRINITY_DN38327_c0_g1_i1.p1  ORF type:complete len:511 (+),score=86.46 TRINITY_DN38327_c0_g1_i1:28-1533(+)
MDDRLSMTRALNHDDPDEINSLEEPSRKRQRLWAEFEEFASSLDSADADSEQLQSDDVPAGRHRPEQQQQQSLQIFTLDELQEAEFIWTIVNGRVHAIDKFIPHHPGGPLIWRGVGEDATHLFEAHHASEASRKVLAKYEIGEIPSMKCKMGPLRAELNRRVARFLEMPKDPKAEIVALSMLILFTLWAYLAYVKGWLVLNVVLAWFWCRQLDAGLHSAVHGDFGYSKALQRKLLQIYCVLCHHMMDYYKGTIYGLSQHYQHHMYTNDIRRDPDFTAFAVGRNWIRRSGCNPWKEYNQWQCLYWLAVKCLLEPVSELFTMVSTCMNGATQILEPPADLPRFVARISDVASWWIEAMIGPGYQGVLFMFQPWQQALCTLLLSKAISKLVLLPFSEVQHFLLPEDQEDCGDDPEFAVEQLRTTANLRLSNSVIRFIDFLMFHGDSLQVEHHLWPSMSFVHLREVSDIVRRTCAEFQIPYHELGYWEAYAKFLHQVRQHALQPE